MDCLPEKKGSGHCDGVAISGGWTADETNFLPQYQ